MTIPASTLTGYIRDFNGTFKCMVQFLNNIVTWSYNGITHPCRNCRKLNLKLELQAGWIGIFGNDIVGVRKMSHEYEIIFVYA